MTSAHSSEPPEDPLIVAESRNISPTSPKPLHIPTPTNIPVLEMQMDVGFNQTEVHMSDPAMHDTDVRPDLWRDPAEHSIGQTQETSLATVDQHGADVLKEQDVQDQQVITPTQMEHIPQASPVSLAVHAEPVAPLATTSDASGLLTPAEAEPALSLPVPLNVADHVHIVPSTAELDVTSSSKVAPPVAAGEGIPVVEESSVSQLDSAALQPFAADSLASSVTAPNIIPPPDIDATLPVPGPVPVGPDAIIESTAIVSTPLDLTLPARVDTIGSTANHMAHITSNLPPRPPVDATPTSLAAAVASIETATPPQQSTHTYPTHFPIPLGFDGKLFNTQNLAPEDTPWEPEIQRKYDHFLEEERKYVSEGRWEQFPVGSRLFVGNLSSEKVTKRDIYHIFHHYGDLAQISIKQAYGFVQFLRAEDCVRALEAEQGTQIRDKKIHLEVSKPQKGRGQDQNKTNNNNSRRSRSPDRRRGVRGSVDRYVSASNGQNEHSRRGTGHLRSPTPPRYRDRNDDRYRDRSPDIYGRNRFRSPSPRRNEVDDLPLPRRAARDVPDVQVLVLDNLDREFISWVEGAFSSRGVRIDVLLLSPRLSEQAVVRRQIVEGVVAVSKLTQRNQATGKIGLQIFDRSSGADNVKFEEYDHLDPPVCAELVLRAKKTQQPPAYQNQYGYGQSSSQSAPSQSYSSYSAPGNAYGQPAPPSLPPAGYSLPPAPNAAPAPSPNLQHLIGNLDPNSLQNLLSAINRQPPPFANPGAQSGYNAQPQQQSRPADAFAALQQNPQALASLLQGQNLPQFRGQAMAGAPGLPTHRQSTDPGSVNMQDILARLGTYKP